MGSYDAEGIMNAAGLIALMGALQGAILAAMLWRGSTARRPRTAGSRS
jgi:hypothetical protein